MSTTDQGPTPPAWASDPDVLERVFHAALTQGDTEGVRSALHLLAGCDPDRAQRLHDALTTALHIAAGGDFEVQIVREAR